MFEIFEKGEFWSAIVGAIVGGLIAYYVQLKELKEGRRHRAEDQKKAQEALGHALLFKILRLHTNFYGVHEHIEERFAAAKRENFKGEPWQFYLPIANLPDSIHFSADEMGMLLSLKDDETFNLVLSMDVIHNSLIAAVKVLNEERLKLTERLAAAEMNGSVASSDLTAQQMQVLAPQMHVVNDLILNLRERARTDFEESQRALEGLHSLLQRSLGFTYKLESRIKQSGLES